MRSSIFVLTFFVLACASADDGGQFLKQTLPGFWKEDQYQRKNLNNYLYYMGKYHFYVCIHDIPLPQSYNQHIIFDILNTFTL